MRAVTDSVEDEGIRALTAQERILARATDERVIVRPGKVPVTARAAVDGVVVAFAAEDDMLCSPPTIVPQMALLPVSSAGTSSAMLIQSVPPSVSAMLQRSPSWLAMLDGSLRLRRSS